MQVIMTADIGGTNCRLGLFTRADGRLALERVVWLPTSGIRHTDDFMAALERELAAPPGGGALVVAMAGPVRDNIRGSLSNGDLTLDFEAHKLRPKNFRCRVVNDFLAQAYATLTACGGRCRKVAGPDFCAARSPRAVIGAGTGLGHASLHWLEGAAGGQWLAVPSENGHAAFPFANTAENEFHAFLRQEFGLPCATGDDVLTGRGLRALHFFLTGERLSASGVGAAALASDTPTLAWYSRFYGRACRNWMLSTLCQGGLWIAGGIAAQNPLCCQNDHFFEELYLGSRWNSFLRSIPVHLVEDKNSGLWGCAFLGMALLDEAGPC